MEDSFQNEYLSELPKDFSQEPDKRNYERCQRCKELEPWIKPDWPYKGLCRECIEIESRGNKLNL